MRRIDELYTELSFLGSRRVALMLETAGQPINRKRVQRLMRRMGIAALGPKPATTKPAPGHKIYPYLLRGLTIDRPNQVWASDITYIPLGRGFLYLVAIIDWSSRAVLAWRLSNTMDVSFCVAALEEALARFGRPDIFNTDQGSQFTSAAFTDTLAAAGIAISMDGRGRWMDNVFIERLWRSLKHEDVYLKHYADGREARAGIAMWMNFYNNRRPHQALANRMPMAVWRAGGGAGAEEAVDMTLVLRTSLDNAGALPTSPQPLPQQALMN
jgi:putative transposase